MPRQLKLALPKGSLQEATLELMNRAGYDFSVGPRSYHAFCDDPEINATLIRAQELARYVSDGAFDVGITGRDWILETGSRVVEVEELGYSRASKNPVRWVLAVSEDSPIKSLKQLQGKRIATELVNYTRAYLKKKGVKAHIEFSWGATEAKVPELADAIVELTETGSSLKAHRLRILEELLVSYPLLIANQRSWKEPWKQEKIKGLALLLKAAINAEARVGLKMNVRKKQLPKIQKLLPAITSPTVSPLSDPEWIALETVLEERQVRELIPRLKAAGAEGIIEYPLNKLIF